MIGPSGDLTLPSLSIKLFEFEFFLSLTTHTHTHTHTHTQTGDRTERGKCGYLIPAATCVPSILEYLFSTCCRRTATSGKMRISCGHREACPAQCLQSWPTPHKLLGFQLGHISFFFLILYKPKTLGLTISTI